jgi:hypothetical protein
LTQLLVLCDVDGTLFLTHDPLAGEALTETLEERFDVRPSHDAIETVDHAGQTALRIARLLLEQAGVPANSIDVGLARWCPHFADRYLELLAGRTRAAGARHPTRIEPWRSSRRPATASRS